MTDRLALQTSMTDRHTEKHHSLLYRFQVFWRHCRGGATLIYVVAQIDRGLASKNHVPAPLSAVLGGWMVKNLEKL